MFCGWAPFAGPLSFMCFGPLFRFVAGAELTARRPIMFVAN
jgi:hypothetical protein